jgi:hypothetical protein
MFLFYSFFFYKLESKRAGQILPREGVRSVIPV